MCHFRFILSTPSLAWPIYLFNVLLQIFTPIFLLAHYSAEIYASATVTISYFVFCFSSFCCCSCCCCCWSSTYQFICCSAFFLYFSYFYLKYFADWIFAKVKRVSWHCVAVDRVIWILTVTHKFILYIHLLTKNFLFIHTYKHIDMYMCVCRKSPYVYGYGLHIWKAEKIKQNICHTLVGGSLE